MRLYSSIVIALIFWKHEIESFPILSLVRRRSSQQHGAFLDETDFGETFATGAYSPQMPERTPIPEMPSSMFQRMAHSQLELLANSLTVPGEPTESKVESMALYLPQENVNTGQLEFTPVVLYPDPNTERIFIASDAASGQAPTLPPTLTKLPGFANATALLPGYPMMSSDQVNPGVGIVEEVLCDARFKNKAAALSVPLLSGSQTVGVLLVSPSVGSNPDIGNVWTDLDREQVSRAAQSLSMALSMDNERSFLKEQNNAFREGLSDSLHQVKNPLQALRTYGKILQRQIANTDHLDTGTPSHLLDLTERLMVQSERVVDLMIPMDTLVENLEQSTRLALQPAKKEKPSETEKSLIVRSKPLHLLPWENETLEFARENSTSSGIDASSDYKTVSSREPQRKETASATKTTKPPSTTVVGDVQLEMTFVGDVLEPILSAFRAISSERGIHFEVAEDSMELPGVMAAPKSLQEAISNVLDNAFKYVVLPKQGSPFLKNPSPHVRVRMVANKGESGVTILVEDNGPGITSESDRENIFNRGFRSETTSYIDGSGIGLDISRTLVERMGGNLDLIDEGEFKNTLNGAVMKCTLFRRPKL
jgi:signal transduction histidine kinase